MCDDIKYLLTKGIRSSPVITATLRSLSPACLAASCKAVAQLKGFTPPALLINLIPELHKRMIIFKRSQDIIGFILHLLLLPQQDFAHASTRQHSSRMRTARLEAVHTLLEQV